MINTYMICINNEGHEYTFEIFFLENALHQIPQTSTLTIEGGVGVKVCVLNFFLLNSRV